MMDAIHEPKFRHDVFVSYRGIDSRYSFVSHLHTALSRAGVNVFTDDKDLERGELISDSVVKAIEESRISIVVLSKNYASSSWCLEELVKILDTMEMTKQLVLPIFYKVRPSDVRHQRNTYGEAMVKHEIEFGEMVKKWRSALSQVTNLRGGWYFETGYEYELIQDIVRTATAKLSRGRLYVDEHLIGIQSRIEEVKSLLEIESGNMVCMVGIHGIGGIGKTTLAKALYDSICDRFEYPIFLEGIRDRSNGFMGLVNLQEALLSPLFRGEKIMLGNVNEGALILKNRFRHLKVLLVLDDVDNREQLRKLAGDCNWFGSGSRIIITTRDKHLLIVHQVEKTYEMKKLDDDEALQLFCWNAFKMNKPATDYEVLSDRVVHYACGLPLALKAIGQILADKSMEDWERELEAYEKIPDGEIHSRLKLSFDSLDLNEKDIFLDIAFFFIGESLEYVEKVLDQCHFFPVYNIQTLVDKSLLTINGYGQLWMHELVRDMGREVVRQEAPINPGERSRLCFHEDVLRVLTENSGSKNIEGIILDPPEREEVEWSGTAFKKMKKLRILIIRNARFSSGPSYLPKSLRLLEWKEYPSESLPNIPWNAVVLSLPDSHIRLKKETPLLKLKHLTYLNLSDCQFVTHIPDVSGVPNLRKLRLDGCINLIAVHRSVGFLSHLVFLSASHCIKLRDFLPEIGLPSLKYLDLHLTGIERFPEIVEAMNELLYISLEHTCIKKLPNSIHNLRGLECLQLQHCASLEDLPLDLFMLPKIEELWLPSSRQVQESFRRFQNSHVGIVTVGPNLRRLYFTTGGLTDEDFHIILGCFPNLEELYVPSKFFASLPAGINESTNLKVLDWSHCNNLLEIPELLLSKKVVATHCPLLVSETSRMLLAQVVCTTDRESRTLPLNYCHSDGKIFISGNPADGSHHK